MTGRKLVQKTWDFLGSRNFSVFIFISGITYFLFLFVFSMIVPLPWVNSISKLLPFKVLYVLFFINLVICEIKWIPAIVKKCKRIDTLQANNDLARFRHKLEINSLSFNVRSISNYLRLKGYMVQTPSVESSAFNVKEPILLLQAYRGRFSPFGNLLFHTSFLFILFGVMLSLLFRFEGSARVTEGYQFSGMRGEYVFMSASPLASLPEIKFSPEKITPEFWEDNLLFTDLRADIKYEGGEGSAWMSAPIEIGGARITLNGIGLTPMYVLKNREGRELDVSYVNLAVYTPGTEDHFQIPGFPHKIYVSFYHDYAVKDGNIINRSMNLNNPAYFVRIVRGRLPVFTGLLRPGEEAYYENLKLSFPEFKYWGDFRIIKDPGFLFVWIAFILFGIGLSWRFLFYRREIVVVKASDKIKIYGNSDYYPELFKNRLSMLGRKCKEL